MTVYLADIIAPRWQGRPFWADVMAGVVGRLLYNGAARITLATQFDELPSGAEKPLSNPEDLMIAKGIRPGEPRSQAAEFAEFISQIANDRSETAFENLFRYFAPRIKSYCLRLGADSSAAEEITQEAMVSVWRNSAKFNPSKASASTWIFTIARNLSIDRFRKQRRPEFDPEDPVLVPEDPQTPDRMVDKIQMEDNVRNILDSLSSKERDVLMLSFYGDLSHSEISRKLNLPIGTVKSRIRLAFAKIRSALDVSDGATK